MGKRLFIITGFFIVCLYALCFAQQSERLTITTYYPSPTGVYQTLRLAPSDNPSDCSDPASAPLGKMYYNSTENSLYICSANATSAGYQLVPGGNGAWAVSGNQLYVLNTTMRVGVGTTNPPHRFDINTNLSNDGFVVYYNQTSWYKLMAGSVGTGSYNQIVQAGDIATVYSNGTQGYGAYTVAPWNTTATSGIRMDKDGNVGIGKAIPTQRLDVVGNITASGKVKENGNDLIPAGMIAPFNLAACPAGWSLADGTAGTVDLRGEFIRGWDNGRGVDTGRVRNSAQAQDFKSFSMQNNGPVSSGYTHGPVYMPKSGWSTEHLFGGKWENPNGGLFVLWDSSEVRPRNVALIYCQKN